jgi:hypothetical protein
MYDCAMLFGEFTSEIMRKGTECYLDPDEPAPRRSEHCPSWVWDLMRRPAPNPLIHKDAVHLTGLNPLHWTASEASMRERPLLLQIKDSGKPSTPTPRTSPKILTHRPATNSAALNESSAAPPSRRIPGNQASMRTIPLAEKRISAASPHTPPTRDEIRIRYL